MKELARSRRRLWVITGLAGLGLLGGSVAYWLTRGGGLLDGLLTTIDTLGYMSDRQEGAALVVQVILLHAGTLISWYIGWMYVDYLLDGHFGRHWREKKKMDTLGALAKHVVVCGGGRVGGHIAELLRERGEPYVIVEGNGARVEALKATHALVVEGDARDEAVLRRAGVDRAGTLVAALRETGQNVLVVLTGATMNERLEIHARCDRADYATKLRRAGAKHVIMPERACAEQIASLIGGREVSATRRAS